MAKLEAKLGKLPKWMKILGFVGLLVVIFYIACLVWVSTWKTYKSDDFGFSFKYPSNWFISGNPISSKTISKAGDSLVFWIDSKQKLPIVGQSEVRSPGDVEVWIYKKPTTFLEDQNKLQDFSRFKKVKYGAKLGLTIETIQSINVTYGTGGSDPNNGKLFASKRIYLETDNYVFSINTVTYSENTSVWSKMIARFYHWIGSSILNSFKFE